MPDLEILTDSLSKLCYPIYLVSGICTEKDIIRGEETEIIGLFENQDYSGYKNDCTVILPGTHSKILSIKSGQIEDFNTYMTGELYAVLSKYSVLKHSLALDNSEDTPNMCDSAFNEGLQMSLDLSLSAALFKVRTNTVLAKYNNIENTDFLKGLLLGQELKDIPSNRSILLLASEKFLAAYTKAAKFLQISDITHVPKELAASIVTLGQSKIISSLNLE